MLTILYLCISKNNKMYNKQKITIMKTTNNNNEMKNIIKNIELPFFSGFYESVYQNCDSDYDYIKEYCEQNEIDDEDKVDVDYTQYHNLVCNEFCKVFNDYAPMYVKSVKFTDLVSPQYYNYSTDRVFADVELTDDWKIQMGEFIKDNLEWLRDRVKQDWSSRDGFISYMDNDIMNWAIELFQNEDERYISQMIGYQMAMNWNGGLVDGDCENIRERIEMEVIQDVCIYDYIHEIA